MARGPSYTLARLREDVGRFRMPPERARAALLEIRGLIDELLVEGRGRRWDAHRVRVYKKVVRTLFWGYGRPELLVLWSKLASMRVCPQCRAPYEPEEPPPTCPCCGRLISESSPV